MRCDLLLVMRLNLNRKFNSRLPEYAYRSIADPKWNGFMKMDMTNNVDMV